MDSSSLSKSAEKLHSPIPPKLAILVAKIVISYSVLFKFDENKKITNILNLHKNLKSKLIQNEKHL